MRKYTLRQIEVFYGETKRRKRERQIDSMHAARSAWLSPTVFQQVIEDLNKQ